MIFEAIVRVFATVLTSLIGALPTVSGLNINYDMSAFFNSLSIANCFVPVTTVLTCLGIVITIYNIDFTYGVIKWIYKKIPGVS